MRTGLSTVEITISTSNPCAFSGILFNLSCTVGFTLEQNTEYSLILQENGLMRKKESCVGPYELHGLHTQFHHYFCVYTQDTKDLCTVCTQFCINCTTFVIMETERSSDFDGGKRSQREGQTSENQ